MQVITNAHRFAQFFNTKVPGAYRSITVHDVLDMKKSGLIGRSSYYGRSDLETVRGILEYEQMREKRSAQEATDDKRQPPKCKMCGQPLLTELENRTGRPREYCSDCEPLRIAVRCRKWRRGRRTQQKPETEIRVVYT